MKGTAGDFKLGILNTTWPYLICNVLKADFYLNR